MHWFVHNITYRISIIIWLGHPFVLAEKPIQRRIYATGVFINQTIHHYWNNRKSERGMVLG